MKTFAAVSVTLLSSVRAVETNPVAKVIDLLSNLQAKIVAEGEEAQQVYNDYAEWCEDTAKNSQFEIKTGKATIADLKATIDEESTRIETLDAKIGELADAIATDEADLTAATQIREKEHGDFAAEEKELVEVVDTLGRAIGILEKEAAGGSFVQLQNEGSVIQALQTLVQASLLSSADSTRLTALVQNSQQSDDDLTGSPAAATYENHSGGILDVLGNLKDEAEGQLADARKKEQAAQHNFEMLKQSLTDQIKNANSETDAAKKEKAQSSGKKAEAEGDLGVSSKDLAEDQSSLATLHANCMAKAQEFEAAVHSRGEELNALATAKKIISETTSGAASQSYGLNQVSFLQTRSKLSSTADLAKFEAVRVVRDLAMQQNSAALAQLATRMDRAMRSNSGSADPFGKVKGLIQDMLAKLEDEADADATEKGYCDKELSESEAKKAEMDTEIAKLTTKIDQWSARSAKLKDEVAVLQKELADLAKSKASSTKFREEEKAAYDKNKAEMEQGLEGIKAALKVLRDYYASDDKAHASADGAGGGIIGLLEVCESDFSKGLAEIIATEEASVAEYTQEMKDNEMSTTLKSKDEEYKTKEHIGLDKAIATHSGDRSGVQTELDAVLDYLAQLHSRCDAKAETYAETKKRRESELAGLKEALQILEGQALLLQKSSHALRIVRQHA
jgi:chromosome segregation ATPase